MTWADLMTFENCRIEQSASQLQQFASTPSSRKMTSSRYLSAASPFHHISNSELRAARRARSGADFVSKISVVVEEMDEPLLWLELLVAASIVKAEAMQAFKNESDELLRFFSTSLMTAKANP